MNDILSDIKLILSELLDMDTSNISPNSYLVRDLGIESIDFLEIAVEIQTRFRIKVKDDDIFLRKLRFWIKEAEETKIQNIVSFLLQKYPFSDEQRISEMLSDLKNGPVLKVIDLISYIKWQLG